jgi:hypothetical protein
VQSSLCAAVRESSDGRKAPQGNPTISAKPLVGAPAKLVQAGLQSPANSARRNTGALADLGR